MHTKIVGVAILKKTENNLQVTKPGDTMNTTNRFQFHLKSQQEGSKIEINVSTKIELVLAP